MTEPQMSRANYLVDPTSLRIFAGYLVEVTDDCNCGGADPTGGSQHERGCGLWPLMTVDELAALISDR